MQMAAGYEAKAFGQSGECDKLMHPWTTLKGGEVFGTSPDLVSRNAFHREYK